MNRDILGRPHLTDMMRARGMKFYRKYVFPLNTNHVRPPEKCRPLVAAALRGYK